MPDLLLLAFPGFFANRLIGQGDERLVGGGVMGRGGGDRAALQTS